MADVIELRAHRVAQSSVLVSSQVLAPWLDEMARMATQGQFLRNPTAAVMILIGPDGPDVAWKGITGPDLVEAQAIINDAIMASRLGEDVAQCVNSGWENRRVLAAQRDLKVEEYRQTFPWICDHCPRRFKTERGANQHERGCFKNPQAVRSTRRPRRPLRSVAG